MYKDLNYLRSFFYLAVAGCGLYAPGAEFIQFVIV